MPLQIGDGKLWLPQPRPWTIDLKTGIPYKLGKPTESDLAKNWTLKDLKA